MVLAAKQLSGKKLYVQDGFAGANPDTRIKVRVVTGSCLDGTFCKKYVYPANRRELEDFEPDFVMLNACQHQSIPNGKKWD